MVRKISRAVQYSVGARYFLEEINKCSFVDVPMPIPMTQKCQLSPRQFQQL